MTKHVFGFPDKARLKTIPQLQRLAKKIENSLVAGLDMLLSNTRMTKALIRLRGCAGWSVPLLFTISTADRFSRVEASTCNKRYRIVFSAIVFVALNGLGLGAFCHR